MTVDPDKTAKVPAEAETVAAGPASPPCPRLTVCGVIVVPETVVAIASVVVILYPA